MTRLHCSGVLISNKHVLVSVHCADELIQWRETLHTLPQIHMGGINFVKHPKEVVKRDIARIYRHENVDIYRDATYGDSDSVFFYDIAILQMDEAVPFGDNIQPICLPQSPFVDYTGKLTTAIGLYDSSTSDKSNLRSKAQQADIPIWTTEQCTKVPDYENKFTVNMICVGNGVSGRNFRYVRICNDRGKIFKPPPKRTLH